MNLDNLNRWLTLLANLGVLAGIVFLAFEIQQNNTIAKAQTRSEISRFQIENTRMFREPMVLQAQEKLATGQALSFQEERFLRNIMRQELKAWENVFYQYRMGLFDEPELEAYRVTWRDRANECRNRFFYETYRSNRMQLEPQFRVEMDLAISTAGCGESGN